MFFLILLFTFLVWLVVRHYQKVSRLPPGPISFPLIGNLPQILFYLKKTGGVAPALDLFRKKYGKIFTLWVGPIPHVNVADFETSHEVFVKNAHKFADKFVPPIFDAVRQGRGVNVTNGEHWQEMRRFALQTFRNMGVGKDIMETKIMEELNARCSDVDTQMVNGRSIQQAAPFFDLTVGSIINSILVGKRFDEESKGEFFEMKEALDRSLEKSTPFDMIVPVWFLKTFFKNRYDELVNIQEEAMDYSSSEAMKRLEEIKKGNYVIDENNLHDFSDAYILRMQQEAEKPEAYQNKHFNVETLRTMIIDLWITGQETTTTTLISGFNQLLLHPETMDKAREELMELTNNASRNLSLTDRASTPYFNALIAEIQRHASILNVNFWRINHEPTYMGGHLVDAGALVCAQLSALHLNETIFENPKEFDPERFIKDESLLQKVIPFGVGKRSCLGESLARSELYLIFGNLLLRYNFKPHGKLSTTELMPYSMAKRPFKLEMEFVKI